MVDNITKNISRVSKFSLRIELNAIVIYPHENVSYLLIVCAFRKRVHLNSFFLVILKA